MKYDSPKTTASVAGEDEIEKKKMTSAFVKTKRGGCESQLFECSKRRIVRKIDKRGKVPEMLS